MSKYKVHKLHQSYILEVLKKEEDVPLVEFMQLVLTGMSGESYHWQLRSLCDVI